MDLLPKNIRPGWILLAILLLWVVIQGARISSLKRKIATLESGEISSPARADQPSSKNSNFIFPIPGACIPKLDSSLPGAARSYRKGENPGFVFLDKGSCAPVGYGTGVVSSGDGEVIKAQTGHKELSPAGYSALIKAVANGANADQMDFLRGREIWIRHADGYTTVYGHLSAIAQGISEGTKVSQGQLIAWVGNSGSEQAAKGSKEAPKLLFEFWDGEPDKDKFFGQKTSANLVRAKTKLQFLIPEEVK